MKTVPRCIGNQSLVSSAGLADLHLNLLIKMQQQTVVCNDENQTAIHKAMGHKGLNCVCLRDMPSTPI